MLPFFRLIRLPNLILIVFTQVSLRFFLFEKFDVSPQLSDWQFTLLSLSTIAIAAAGNIINDIYDQQTDLVNKPNKVVVNKQISSKTAWILFGIFNCFGILIGIYLSLRIQKPFLLWIFIAIAALLLLYAKYLKRSFLLGNILISFLTAMVFIIVGLFDLPQELQFFNFKKPGVYLVLLHFAAFAFLISVIREIIKDQEDIKGDYKAGMATLPIILGVNRTKNVIFICTSFTIVFTVYYLYSFLFFSEWAVLFVLFLIVAPLAYFLIRLTSAKTKYHFQNLETFLKVLMLIGIIAIVLYPEM